MIWYCAKYRDYGIMKPRICLRILCFFSENAAVRSPAIRGGAPGELHMRTILKRKFTY